MPIVKMDTSFQLIVHRVTPGFLFGAWGGLECTVHIAGECDIKPGSYVKFMGHVGDDGVVVCTKLICYTPPSHDLNYANDESYSWLLSAVRKHVRDAIEIRPPAIVSGLADRSFVLNCNGKMARLVGSHALYCTLGAIKFGRCFSIEKAFRREEQITLRHLNEFDLFQYGELGMTADQLMEYVECLIRQIHAEASLKYPNGKMSRLSESPFKRLPWRRLRELTPKSIGDDDISSVENIALKDIWKESDNPIFITDMPADLSSWNTKVSEDGLSSTFNLIFPSVGEVIEGSQRNTDREDFQRRFQGKKNLASHFDWLLEGLIYPNVPVSVFGMGMERFAMWLYGIRDIKLVRQYTSHAD